ncbi:MAG: FtsH protease activity modulator HflK [Chloroflexi bacterium]|nr:MAG: FtsH protease activity modulator HflK [Chloroflexota bacterium]HMN12840.1 FtsH protease activity modulator HflK [Bellilinea sp.]
MTDPMSTPPESPEPPPRLSSAWRWWLRTLSRASQQGVRILVGEGESPLADVKAAFGHLNLQRVAWGGVGVVLLVYLLTGVYIVNPGEAGVVRQFGAVVVPRAEPGMHYRLPWPLARVDVVNVNDVRREVVGVLAPEEGHDHPEPPAKLQVLSGDTNVIDIELIVQYQVRDPAAFLVNVRYAPYLLVRDVARQTVTELFSRQPVDAILTTERQTLQTAIRSEMQQHLDAYNSGLAVLGINVQKAFPPDEVADAFTDVNSAREDKARAVNEANGYANSTLPEARGQAQQLLAGAAAYRSEALGQSNGAAQAFASMLAEYQANARIYGKEVTRYRLFLETFDKILARTQVYVVDTENGGTVNLRLMGNAARSSSVDGAPQASNPVQP